MDDKPSLKGAWLRHVNHLNFGGHQPYLWNDWSSQVLSTTWTVSVVNCWRQWQFIALTVDICVQHSGRETLRREGLAAETCKYWSHIVGLFLCVFLCVCELCVYYFNVLDFFD